MPRAKQPLRIARDCPIASAFLDVARGLEVVHLRKRFTVRGSQAAQETTASMADTERRAGEGHSSRPCAASGMPVVMVAVVRYFAAAGFFTCGAPAFRAALFGSFRSTVLRSS